MISVLLPTYNYARYLPEAIESVLAQDDENFELIISDDGSTDDSAAVIRRYAAVDARIRYQCHTANLGMVANWNWCLREARGQYLKYLFGDDCLASRSALSTMRAMLEGNPAATLVASARLLLDEASSIVGFWSDLPAGQHDGPRLAFNCLRTRRNLIGEPTTVMFRRQGSERGFDPAYRQIVDMEMWFHLLMSGSLIYTPEPLCAFRRHSTQQTVVNNRARVTDNEMFALLGRYLEAPPLRRHLRRGSFTHRQIIFRQLHYMRKARAGSADTADVQAGLRAQLPGAWFPLCWVWHRLTRPLENLSRKLTRWSRWLPLLGVRGVPRHPPAHAGPAVIPLAVPSLRFVAAARLPLAQATPAPAARNSGDWWEDLAQCFQHQTPRRWATGMIAIGIVAGCWGLATSASREEFSPGFGARPGLPRPEEFAQAGRPGFDEFSPPPGPPPFEFSPRHGNDDPFVELAGPGNHEPFPRRHEPVID